MPVESSEPLHLLAVCVTLILLVHQGLALSVSTLTMRDSAMASTYDSLASRAMDRHSRHQATLKNGQLFVCVAGGPGSGKTTLSSAVAARVNDRLGAGSAVVLPMDGFHFSKAELRAMADADSATHSYEELMARRGAPWTFDAVACVKAFTDARNRGTATLPTYSREISDPVPGGVILEKSTSIVFLEGNYLLAWDDPAWSPLRNAFDETWYIACSSIEKQRERLISRSLKTWSEEKARMWGEGRAGATARADANDVLNAEWIDRFSRHHADIVIESK